MSANIVVSPEAQRDIDDQAEYYLGSAGLAIAVRFLNAVEETFTLIAAQPVMGRRRRFRDPRLGSTRWVLVIHFEEHIVFYRTAGDRVEVLRLIHGKQDLHTMLGESHE